MGRTKNRYTVMRALPCQLSEEEADTKGAELARATMDERAYELAIATLVENHKNERKRLEGNLQEMVGTRIKLAQEITTRTVERDIECEWSFNVFGDGNGRAILIRTDSGEAVESREMTKEEHQTQLGETIVPPSRDQIRQWEKQLAKREAEKAGPAPTVPGEVTT